MTVLEKTRTNKNSICHSHSHLKADFPGLKVVLAHMGGATWDQALEIAYVWDIKDDFRNFQNLGTEAPNPTLRNLKKLKMAVP